MGTFERRVIVAATYCIGFPVVMTALANAKHLPSFVTLMWSEEGAGWAQAVTSVIAVVTALYVAGRSASDSRKLALEIADRDAKDRKRAAFAVASAFKGQLDAVIEELRSSNPSSRKSAYGPEYVQTIEVHCAALARFPVEIVTDPRGIEAFVDVAGMAVVAKRYLEDGPVLKGPGNIQFGLQFAEDILANWLQHLSNEAGQRIDTLNYFLE